MRAIKVRWYLAWVALAPESVEKNDFQQKQHVHDFYMWVERVPGKHVLLRDLPVTPLQEFSFDSYTRFLQFQSIAEAIAFPSLDGGLTGPRLSRGSVAHALAFSLLNDWHWFIGDSLSIRHCAGNVRIKQSCLVLKAKGGAWTVWQQIIHEGKEEGMTTSTSV